MSSVFRSKKKIVFLALFICQNAMAFDPFSILSMGSSAVGGIGSAIGITDVAQSASEVADGIDATNEFAQELGLQKETSSDHEIRDYIQQMREIEETLYEAGFTKSEVESFTYNLRRGTNSFAQNVRQLTQIARRLKNMSGLMGKLGGLVGLGGGSTAEKERMTSDAKNLKVLKDIQSEIIKTELQKLKDKVRAYKVYKNIRAAEVQSRSELIKHLNRNSTFGGSSPVGNKATQMAWAILGVVLMVSGLLFGCGLAVAGRILLVSALSASAFFLVIHELVSMIQRSAL